MHSFMTRWAGVVAVVAMAVMLGIPAESFA